MKLFALTFAWLATTLCLAEEVTVKTDKGTVKGIREDHDAGQYYYAFKSIPYAQPPTGKLRFKAPVEAEPWTGDYDASEDGNILSLIHI